MINLKDGMMMISINCTRKSCIRWGVKIVKLRNFVSRMSTSVLKEASNVIDREAKNEQ